MYHYFCKNKIVTTAKEINISLNPSYIPFTDEQEEFYAEHPDANYWEVQRCQMDPKPVPPTTPTLEEVKQSAKNELSYLSLAILDKFVKEYQLANAQSSLYILSVDPKAQTVYTQEKATEVMVKYNGVGNDLRNIYYEAETDIDDCEDVDEVYTMLEYYKDIYNNYKYENSNVR